MAHDDDLPPLGLLLKQVFNQYVAAMDEVLAPFGLNQREWSTLRNLGGPAARSQAEIARALQVDRTTMVALVDALEGKGLLERRPDPADRRRNALVVTDAGRDLGERSFAAIRDLERRYLGDLDAADAAAFKRTLRVLATR